MLDSELETKCRATNSLRNHSPSEKQICAKCPELEQQLQQILEELSSVQEIVQILRNEYIPEDSDTVPTQQIEAASGRNDVWKTTTSTRGSRIHTKGNIELLNHKDQIITENRYAVLGTVTDVPGNDTKWQTVQTNYPTDKNTRQLRNKRCTERDYLIMSKSQEGSIVKTKVQPNLRNPRCACKQLPLKEEQATYTIQTITNGQVSNKEVRKIVNQWTVLQKGRQHNTPKMITTSTHKKQKILIIGDSHV